MLSSVKSCCWILFILGLLPLPALPQGGTPLGGLKFHGSEQPINQRTSYNVFGDRTIRFSNSFAIEFSLSLYPTTEFGYILRIKNKESNRIYNLFYDGQGRNLIFKLNEEGTNSLIVAHMDREELLDKHWFRMKLSFNLKSDSIHLTIHDRTFGTGENNLPDSYEPVILFGKSDHIIDVPSFAIRDVMVGNEEPYVFALNEIEGDIVHDRRGRKFGTALNPEWLMNDAYHWRYKASFRSRSVAGANYNPEKKEIYYFNKDSLFIYNVRSGVRDIRVFDEKSPVRLMLGTNFIDTRHDKLYAYEVYYSSPNQDYDGATVASLDLNTFEWTPLNFHQLPSQLHHHGSYLNPTTDHYTIFGGFGNMRYSKNFFSFDLQTNEWSTLEGFSGDIISPRYFSSVGYLKETNSIYVFGGMGNESGEQTVGRKYYYDFYKVDLNTKQVSKLWEIEWKQDNVVPVRGMVILNDSSFYTLCYPEHFSQSFLQLYRFSLKDGRYEILGDSIPIYSDKITTNANLYYDSGLNNLYAVVQEFEDDISSDLKVYSLAFPPITAQQLASYSRKGGYPTLVIAIMCVCLASGAGYIIFRKLRSRYGKRSEAQKVSLINNKAEPVTRPNAVYLFGDFMVRDRKNRDITYLFSEQLKQVFCLILQYSTTEEGIASQRLSSIIWPDKPADKVKNSRGVTINHLRKALSELDGIELIYEKGFFKLVQSAGFYCDYSRCLEIIGAHVADENRQELAEVVTRGKFLQLSNHPLFDSFKEEIEKKLEPVLLLEMEKTFEAELYPLTIAFADAVFHIDPLNDNALTFQLKAMQKLKMTDEAKIRYQSFVLEHKKLMGSDYLPHKKV